MTHEFSWVLARWGDRAESASECAVRLAAFLTRLAALHPDLAAWDGLVGEDETVPPEAWRLGPDVARAERFVRQCRRDDGDPPAYAGFRLALLSADRSLSLSICCGGHRHGPDTGNSVALFFPEPAPATALRYGRDTVRDLVIAVAEVWRPEWATFTDSLLDTGRTEARRHRPVGFLNRPVGFLTWTPGATAPVLADRPFLTAEPLTDGTLLSRPGW
ncbi:Imm52 family immunity protein [Streptomyces sp. NPDC032940]|uniref:Imm52 family immunity protein n=1 Tax=Streptomyces sp. NPDC032940 TaxID=3155366 RepID=UPI0033C8CEF6